MALYSLPLFVMLFPLWHKNIFLPIWKIRISQLTKVRLWLRWRICGWTRTSPSLNILNKRLDTEPMDWSFWMPTLHIEGVWHFLSNQHFSSSLRKIFREWSFSCIGIYPFWFLLQKNLSLKDKISFILSLNCFKSLQILHIYNSPEKLAQNWCVINLNIIEWW